MNFQNFNEDNFLILGDSGSGKSFLLKKLIKEKIENRNFKDLIIFMDNTVPQFRTKLPKYYNDLLINKNKGIFPFILPKNTEEFDQLFIKYFTYLMQMITLYFKKNLTKNFIEEKLKHIFKNKRKTNIEEILKYLNINEQHLILSEIFNKEEEDDIQIKENKCLIYINNIKIDKLHFIDKNNYLSAIYVFGQIIELLRISIENKRKPFLYIDEIQEYIESLKCNEKFAVLKNETIDLIYKILFLLEGKLGISMFSSDDNNLKFIYNKNKNIIFGRINKNFIKNNNLLDDKIIKTISKLKFLSPEEGMEYFYINKTIDNNIKYFEKFIYKANKLEYILFTSNLQDLETYNLFEKIISHDKTLIILESILFDISFDKDIKTENDLLKYLENKYKN